MVVAFGSTIELVEVGPAKLPLAALPEPFASGHTENDAAAKVPLADSAIQTAAPDGASLQRVSHEGNVSEAMSAALPVVKTVTFLNATTIGSPISAEVSSTAFCIPTEVVACMKVSTFESTVKLLMVSRSKKCCRCAECKMCHQASDIPPTVGQKIPQPPKAPQPHTMTAPASWFSKSAACKRGPCRW